ncbi:MAG: capsule assembly Wzi family protein [Muribaculaceae bacterium]|nr:capsule assembly Wzi family protein [Muribaculaceae bacterium]
MHIHKILILLLALTGPGLSAMTLPDSISYSIEGMSSLSSGNNTPFWLANNKFGLSSIKKNNGYLRAGLFKEANKNGKRFAWGAGVDLAVAYNFSSTFIVQQLYADLRYRCLGLTVGSKEFTSGFNNPRLSSGNLLFSPNARPIPQARIEIPEYTTVPWTKGWLSVKGFFSYGFFTDDRWQKSWAAPGSKRTEHVLFHSKGGFLKIADPDGFPLSVEGGLQMAAQFGGKSIAGDRIIDMPNGIKDWLKVIIPSAGGSDTPVGEQTNVYGNHVGDWNFAINWTPRDADWGLRLYYDHYFEDHSMMFFDYTWRDMLLGVEAKLPKNPIVSTIVYEYLYTKDQAGPVYWDHTPEIPEQVSGRDQYYNHGIYTGWQHWGMGIGNPLAISPVYNRNHSIDFRHNRLKGHHLGFEGHPIPLVSYRVLLSYTRSWGTYDIPTSKVMHNFNTLLETTFTPERLKGWSATLSLGSDGGGLLGPSVGAMLSIKKTGWL